MDGLNIVMRCDVVCCRILGKYMNELWLGVLCKKSVARICQGLLARTVRGFACTEYMSVFVLHKQRYVPSKHETEKVMEWGSKE